MRMRSVGAELYTDVMWTETDWTKPTLREFVFTLFLFLSDQESQLSIASGRSEWEDQAKGSGHTKELEKSF